MEDDRVDYTWWQGPPRNWLNIGLHVYKLQQVYTLHNENAELKVYRPKQWPGADAEW